MLSWNTHKPNLQSVESYIVSVYMHHFATTLSTNNPQDATL